MTQRTQSLLGEEAYRNPRHAQEAAEFEASQAQAQAQSEAQGNEPTATSEPVHNYEKRYKDLQSWSSKEMHKMRQEINDLQVKLASQSTPKLAAPKSPEELEAFKQANPEMYGVIEHMAHSIAKAHIESTDLRVAAMSQDLQATKQERAKLAIQEAHPDFGAIVNDPKFHEWTQRQTQEVQDWILNNPDDPDKAIRALNLFKYEANLSQPKETQAVETDLAVTSNGIPEGNEDLNHPQRIWKASEIRAINPRDYPKYAEMIDLANREGRVRNDL